MENIDRRAIEDFGIPGTVLMEKAGLGLAELARKTMGSGPFLIVCGTGNNGGDGIAAARFLMKTGSAPRVLVMGRSDQLKPDSAFHLRELLKEGGDVSFLEPHLAGPALQNALKGCSGVIDALFGRGLNRVLSLEWCGLIHQLNSSGKPVVSADLPSGLHADTGEVMGACVRASATAVFGGVKRGLTLGMGPSAAGEISLVDIGLPRELLD